MNDTITAAYALARTRLILLDYDGVLAPIVPRQELAVPAGSTLDILRSIASPPDTQVVVISGRVRDTLEQWLGSLPIDMSAEHGHFDKRAGVWEDTGELDMSWQASVRSAMERLCGSYPGSFIEPKQASLVWHFRQVEQVVDEETAMQIISEAANDHAIVMSGKCVIDVRARGADKGTAAKRWYDVRDWDFVLCIGDDVTDEAMFAALTATAWTFHVGDGMSRARYRLSKQKDVIELLRALHTSQQHT